MSSNRENLQLVLDNRCNVGAASTGLVRISGQNVNMFQVNADGAAGSFGSQITFNNVVVPSLSNTLISRNARLLYTLQVTVNSTAGGAFPLLPKNVWDDAYFPDTVLRAYPLSSCCDTISAVFNGATTNINARQVLSALQRRIPKEYIKEQATECPCQSDNTAQLVVDDLGTALTSNQVLSSYYNSDGTTRASFAPYSWVVAGNQTTYQFNIMEPIFVSPFALHDHEVYMSNINTLSLTFNYSNLMDCLVSGKAGGFDPTLVTLTVINPKLQLTYIQVSSDIVQIPRLTTLPYEVVNYQPKSNTGLALNPASSTILTSDNLRFNSMPSLIYIFARIPIAQRNGTQASSLITDSFAGCGDLTTGAGGLSISIGTRTGLLANSSLQSLYRMSRRNGYNSSFNDWSRGSGSLVIIDPVEDLGVDVNAGDILPGESGNVNFLVQYSVNGAPYANAGVALPTSLELMVIPVYSGTASFTADNCVFNIGELNPREVEVLLKTAPKQADMVSSEIFRPTIQGAGLFSKFKSVLGHTANALKSDIGKKVTGYALDKLKDKISGGVLSAA